MRPYSSHTSCRFPSIFLAEEKHSPPDALIYRDLYQMDWTVFYIFAGHNCVNDLGYSFVYNTITIMPTISNKMIGIYSFGESASLCATSCGTCCNKNSDWQTMRIHGQMYLCVESPFMQPISWLPPRAPAACG
jgi:hypothetical protein